MTSLLLKDSKAGALNTCPVCDENKTRMTTPCEHFICNECLDSWRSYCFANGNQFTCPICRHEIEHFHFENEPEEEPRETFFDHIGEVEFQGITFSAGYFYHNSNFYGVTPEGFVFLAHDEFENGNNINYGDVLRPITPIPPREAMFNFITQSMDAMDFAVIEIEARV